VRAGATHVFRTGRGKLVLEVRATPPSFFIVPALSSKSLWLLGTIQQEQRLASVFSNASRPRCAVWVRSGRWHTGTLGTRGAARGHLLLRTVRVVDDLRVGWRLQAMARLAQLRSEFGFELPQPLLYPHLLTPCRAPSRADSLSSISPSSFHLRSNSMALRAVLRS
jgi:hypothetical protein